MRSWGPSVPPDQLRSLIEQQAAQLKFLAHQLAILHQNAEQLRDAIIASRASLEALRDLVESREEKEDADIQQDV